MARVYQTEILNAWKSGKALVRPSMFTDGNKVWSYGYHYPIIIREADGSLLVNTSRYSATTNSQIRATAIFVEDNGWKLSEVDVPRKGYLYARYVQD